MSPFTRLAIFAVAREAGFIALAAFTLMLAFSVAPPRALAVAASAALTFALALMLRACCLTEERLVRSEAWRALDPEQRPKGDQGRRWARSELESLLLHFAKGASGVAGILYSSALVMSAAT